MWGGVWGGDVCGGVMWGVSESVVCIQCERQTDQMGPLLGMVNVVIETNKLPANQNAEPSHMTFHTHSNQLPTHFLSFRISSSISITLEAFSLIILKATCSSPTSSNLSREMREGRGGGRGGRGGRGIVTQQTTSASPILCWTHLCLFCE